ncbi:protein involved in utilization of DNA as a carbon source [Escherichia coli]|uniref:Protein involved in utilization of DNA as a carbon source n=1 Tax=Escherichia coli TaxID=562 RepID=A0A376TQL7_ECOLX|nr:protein involved in utilization of DNA as a carbon source [Escherichia coli]
MNMFFDWWFATSPRLRQPLLGSLVADVSYAHFSIIDTP